MTVGHQVFLSCVWFVLIICVHNLCSAKFTMLIVMILKYLVGNQFITRSFDSYLYLKIIYLKGIQCLKHMQLVYVALHIESKQRKDLVLEKVVCNLLFSRRSFECPEHT